MYILNWQLLYDWLWMLGFFVVCVVSSVEMVVDSYYVCSLVVGEYCGVVIVILDIVCYILYINLSVGLEFVVVECLVKMSCLFDL